MEPQIDPGLALVNKVLLPLLASFREKPWLRALHGKFLVPPSVAHFPDTSHSAPDSVGDHFVSIKYSRSPDNLLISNGIPFPGDSHLRNVRPAVLFLNRSFAHTQAHAKAQALIRKFLLRHRFFILIPEQVKKTHIHSPSHKRPPGLFVSYIIQQKQIMHALTCIYLLYIVVSINLLH